MLPVITGRLGRTHPLPQGRHGEAVQIIQMRHAAPLGSGIMHGHFYDIVVLFFLADDAAHGIVGHKALL